MNLNTAYNKYILGDLDFEGVLNASLPIIYNIISKNKSYYINKDDYIQEAYITLFYCLNNYKESKKISFLTYFVNNVKWNFIEYSWKDTLIKKPNYLYDKNIDRKKFEIISDKIRSKECNCEVPVLDFYNSIEYEEYLISKIESEEKLSLLDINEIDILNLIYKGYTYNEIGEIKNKTRGYVFSRLNIMKNKINKKKGGLYDK